MNDRDLARLAADAWIFGYPLVLLDVAREVATAQGLPINTFDHVRAFPDHTFTDVATPDVDTLRSSAWLDLRAQPLVLSLPATSGRYHVLSVQSAWTEVFAAPGSRTTGDEGAELAICPPGWTGVLPVGVTRVDAPTALVRVVGRTSAAGTKDYLAVHALQYNYLLTPLSELTGQAPPPRPAPPMSAAGLPDPADLSNPVDQVARMDGPTFFARLARLLGDNPPVRDDSAIMDRLAVLGLRSGEPPDLPNFPALSDFSALPQVEAAVHANGWTIWRGLGNYGTDYAQRAAVAFLGLGGHLDADIVCLRGTADHEGRPLAGGHQYVLHFPPGQLPPVRGFWSLTMYDDKQLMVDNPIDRYAIGSRDDLVFGDDGSLDLWLQHDDPGPGLGATWLPAPTGSFAVILRAYWPGQSLVDGSWTPPPLVRLS